MRAIRERRAAGALKLAGRWRPSSIQGGPWAGWLGQRMRQAAVVPHPPGRAPVAACGAHVRRIVSLRQLAAQQGVEPDIGTPR